MSISFLGHPELSHVLVYWQHNQTDEECPLHRWDEPLVEVFEPLSFIAFRNCFPQVQVPIFCRLNFCLQYVEGVANSPIGHACTSADEHSFHQTDSIPVSFSFFTIYDAHLFLHNLIHVEVNAPARHLSERKWKQSLVQGKEPFRSYGLGQLYSKRLYFMSVYLSATFE